MAINEKENENVEDKRSKNRVLEIFSRMSNAIVNGIAGAGGGIVAQIITYPLQTVSFCLSLSVFVG